MVALQIRELKSFTKQLFIGDTFDSFQLREAELVTFNRFSIDGKIRKSYYSEEAKVQNIEAFSYWSVIKPFCFSVIKGNKLPESFRIIFQLSKESLRQFLLESGLSISEEQISGLYLNIKYEDQVLFCITGSSLNQFTLDKSLDQEWDQAVKTFLKQRDILFEEQ